MIVSVLYANREGARFDADYYRATHIPLVHDIWHPDRVDLIEGLPGPDGSPAPYAMIVHIHFASADAMGTAMAQPRGVELQADVANFTDLVPVVSFGRAVGQDRQARPQ